MKSLNCVIELLNLMISKTIMILALVVTFVAGTITTSALIYADGGPGLGIHACVSNSGSLRLVADFETCKKSEDPIHWSILGPAGADGADGATGADGADGATGATGATGSDGADGTVIVTHHEDNTNAGSTCQTSPASFANPSSHGWCPNNVKTTFVIGESSVSVATSVIVTTFHNTFGQNNCEVGNLGEGLGFFISCASAPNNISQMNYAIFN